MGAVILSAPKSYLKVEIFSGCEYDILSDLFEVS